jgi:hypothetical protein
MTIHKRRWNFNCPAKDGNQTRLLDAANTGSERTETDDPAKECTSEDWQQHERPSWSDMSAELSLLAPACLHTPYPSPALPLWSCSCYASALCSRALTIALAVDHSHRVRTLGRWLS